MRRLTQLVVCALFISMSVVLSGCKSEVAPAAESNLVNSASASVNSLFGTFSDGVTWQYTGGVSAGRQHGEGELLAANGYRFKGLWGTGREMQGTRTYANGDVETGNFVNGKTTLKQAINGLESIRTYSNWVMVKSESGGDLQAYMQVANYDKAYAVHGTRPILGMEFQQNEESGGLDVVRLVPNAPAQLAGVQAGDRILQYAGESMSDKMQFLRAVQATSYGSRVKMRVERVGQVLDLDLIPSIRPDSYRPGPGMVEKNSYDELFDAYLADLANFDERIQPLELPAKYSAQAQSRKQRYIAGRKAGQACALVEEMWVYQGSACNNGLAHGTGEAVHLTSDLRFVGEFSQGVRIKGLIIASGIEMYDGPVKNGRPDGAGICFHEGEPEECKFYRGKRVDAVYKQRIALAKQRQFMEEQQAKQQAQIDSLRNDVKNTQFAIQQRSAAPSAAGLQQGMGDVLLDAAKRKAADKVMDAVFDKLF